MDFNAVWKAARLPALIVTLLWLGIELLSLLLSLLASPTILAWLPPVLALVLIPVNAVVFAYAGLACTKDLKQDLLAGGAAGALAALVSGVATFILSLGVVALQAGLFGMQTGATGETMLLGAGYIGAVGLAGRILAAIINIPASVILNFFIALIGGFVGQRM